MVQINGTTRCKEVFIHGKNDIPAEQPLEKTDPRFPCSYENKSRPYCSEEKKSKGQKGIKCLIKKSARRGWGIHCPALLVSDRTGITVGSTDPANVSAIGPGSAMWWKPKSRAPVWASWLRRRSATPLRETVQDVLWRRSTAFIWLSFRPTMKWWCSQASSWRAPPISKRKKRSFPCGAKPEFWWNKMKELLIGLVRFYRAFISPLKPPCCRFYPTCSEYALQALQKYGALKGSWLAIKRISKCHPFHKGGYDPLPWRGCLFSMLRIEKSEEWGIRSEEWRCGAK